MNDDLHEIRSTLDRIDNRLYWVQVLLGVLVGLVLLMALPLLAAIVGVVLVVLLIVGAIVLFMALVSWLLDLCFGPPADRQGGPG